jgi:DNA-binding transcriptional MerR regulator
VRNYEEDGILPAAERSAGGHRIYRPAHAHALRAFLALIPAHGHGRAADIMRAVNAGDLDAAFALLDASHAQLADDRRTLASVEAAVRGLAAPDGSAARGPVHIGPLAHRLGLRPATLRKWERAGLVVPRRDPATGYRTYSPADVRDAHLVHQLRRGGYLLRQIAPVVEQVRHAGGVAALEEALEGWRSRLTRRGLAMLESAAELSRYLAEPHG